MWNEALAMNKRHFILAATALFSLIGLAPMTASAEDSAAPDTQNKLLNKFHGNIQKNFADVTHVTPAQIDVADEDVILFDVREADEFVVSHIDGALRVDPSLDAEEFMAQFTRDWTGKKIVFYCSVGQRSSMMAAATQTALKERGAAQVANLEKGVFGWHNQSLPLINEKGQTDKVHPYNAFWKRLVNRKDKTAYKP
jgi:rhodanese-related sulfurtransferase